MRNLTEMSDGDLIHRAVRAYFRHGWRSANVPDQPNPTCSGVRGGKVIFAHFTHRRAATPLSFEADDCD